MVGNTVPVNLGRYVARALEQYINPSPFELTDRVASDFKKWLIEGGGLTGRSVASDISRLHRAAEIVSLGNAHSEGSYLMSSLNLRLSSL